VLARFPYQLRADLMRYYHVSLDGVGTDYSYRDAAAMVAYLPPESAVLRAEGNGWSEVEKLLAEIARNTAVIYWQRTDHTAPGNDEPPRYMSPHERVRAAHVGLMSLDEKKRTVADAYGYGAEVLNG